MSIAESLLANDPASQMLGIELVEQGNESCVVSMLINKSMTNGYDVCHGGFIYTLADTACAFACARENKIILSSSGQIEYLSPAVLGDKLIASAKVGYTSHRAIYCDVEVKSNGDKVNAFFRGKLIVKH